jgi:O-methyltransferase
MIRNFAKAVNAVLGTTLQRSNVFLTGSLDYLYRKRNIDKNYFDYVRLATLELVSHEIKRKKLDGQVAELGVYKGKFARYINGCFPERKLYLFDTFKGFDGRDVSTEKNKSYSEGNQDFSDTSVEAVLKQMPLPKQCEVRKGFFPETAAGLNETFVFVSIDTDLYEPIYTGLCYFYSRLAKGGYIFVHDYNNDNYKGAAEAVNRFCNENNISVVPIPDSGGTVIIAK